MLYVKPQFFKALHYLIPKKIGKQGWVLLKYPMEDIYTTGKILLVSLDYSHLGASPVTLFLQLLYQKGDHLVEVICIKALWLLLYWIVCSTEISSIYIICYLSLSIHPILPPSVLNIGWWCSKPIAEAKGALWFSTMVNTVLHYPLHLCSVSSSPMWYLPSSHIPSLSPYPLPPTRPRLLPPQLPTVDPHNPVPPATTTS